MKVILSEFGQSLGVSRDCFTIKQNKKILDKVPFWKTSEIVVASKNSVSVDSLLWASLYNVDVTFTMHNGKPLAFLHSIKNEAKVETRLNQLRAYDTIKGFEIAKTILLHKIENENNHLKHLNLKPYEQNRKVPSPSEIAKIKTDKSTTNLRLKLAKIEADYSLWFYRQIFPLFPRWLRITNRAKRNATEPLNNLLNLSFEVLQWKVMKAIIKAKLEPYLGFLHAEAYVKPSLVCDLIEPFRPYIVHFLLNYSQTLEPKDFKRAFIKNKPPRYFLKHEATWNLIQNLNRHLFEAYIPQQIKRKVGYKMQFETFIEEYASNLAKTLNTSTFQIAKTTFPQPLTYNQRQWSMSISSSSLCLRERPDLYKNRFPRTTIKNAETTFPKPLPTNGKQWTTSSSTSSMHKVRPRENPENSVPSLDNPKKRRKTHYYHAKKGYSEEVEE